MTEQAVSGRRPKRLRPYLITRGRTTTDRILAVHTLITTVDYQSELITGMLPEMRDVYEACNVRPLSIAEISALIRQPLLVVRVLVSDLLRRGRVRTSAAAQPDDETLERRVLGGIDSLERRY
jgi:hypothetical protein